MSLLRGSVSINRTLVTIVLLLTLPLLLDLTRLPDSSAAQEYVFSLLTPCDGVGLCNLCGEVLEMVDLVQRALANPFQDKLTLSPEEWDAHGLQSYQRCLREPFLRGCDTLLHKIRMQRIDFAKGILEQVVEDVQFRQKWGSLGEDYVIDNAVQLTTYIFDSQERSLGGRRDPRKEDGAARNIVYQPSTLSLGGDPEVESLVTRVWFLRRDVLLLHQDFCYPVCEGRLTVFGRVQVALLRFYVRHAIKPRLLLLRQQHRGTLVVAELMMIGLAFCVERVMRPGLTCSGTVARRSGRVHGGTASSTSTGSGLVSGVHGEDSAAAATSGGGSGDGGGGGKLHCRPGRRRRWVVVV
ncbi:hypothetical protein, conserved [Leishmania donovani]|uniref:Saposin B-type domain-containing protein n=1 Tax=Leishmania donovani TaxID=5661 RepID=E9BUN1_LEIDO|nr:hypothetical protein, conserved [Leishmania donovani]AYU83879.1 hypothetical protein LdCL_360059500 [Leishmania donovani]CBZ38960.1 hypothetical protein, conserved [Leishmania donovani]